MEINHKMLQTILTLQRFVGSFTCIMVIGNLFRSGTTVLKTLIVFFLLIFLLLLIAQYLLTQKAKKFINSQYPTAAEQISSALSFVSQYPAYFSICMSFNSEYMKYIRLQRDPATKQMIRNWKINKFLSTFLIIIAMFTAVLIFFQ